MLNEATGSYNLRYHSKLKSKEWKKINKIQRLKQIINENAENNKTNSVQTEENESKKSKDESASNESESDKEMECENSAYARNYPPCIRAILIESSGNDSETESNLNRLGSLFIVPYTGGYIGDSDVNKAEKNNYAIDLRNEKEVDQLHAKIEYDLKEKIFTVEG